MGEPFGFDFTVLVRAIFGLGRKLAERETFGLGRGLSERDILGVDRELLELETLGVDRELLALETLGFELRLLEGTNFCLVGVLLFRTDEARLVCDGCRFAVLGERRSTWRCRWLPCLRLDDLASKSAAGMAISADTINSSVILLLPITHLLTHLRFLRAWPAAT